MKNLSICFVNANARPLFIEEKGTIRYGGAEVQIFQLVNYLASLPNYTLNLITAGPKPFAIRKVDGVNVYTALSTVRRWGIFSKMVAAIRLCVALYTINADVYVQRALGVETGLVRVYCKLRRKKFVYMIAHEWDVSGQFLKENGLIGRIAFSGLRHADLRIAQNVEQQELLRKQYDLNAVVFPSVHTMPADILPEDQREYILWVGRAEQWKQPQLFLEVVKRMPTEDFLMIMPEGNYPELYTQILEEAKQLSNLRLITAVPFEKIDTYFELAKVFVNTSTAEGFPNTYIQATKYGTPIVSIHVDPDRIIERYALGVATHDDTIAVLETAIQHVISPDHFPSYSKQSAEYAKEFHDIAKFGNVFSTLLQTVTD